MKIDTKKMDEMFDYLSAEELTHRADGAFVFCRWDPRVASRVSDLFGVGLIDYCMFTGGIGKDSGYLADLGIAEAQWQAANLNLIHGVPQSKIYVEPTARNGGENCRKGIDVILANDLPHDNLVLVCHATSLRRVYAMMQQTAEQKGFNSRFQRVATHYPFNAGNPVDYKEAVGEILRMADWPSHKNEVTGEPEPWLKAQPDLPLDLVDYARFVNDAIKRGDL